MTDIKKRIQSWGKLPWMTIGIVALLLVFALLLLKSCLHNNQAIRPTAAQIYFEGEYRIGEGEWAPIVKGQHIPATQGDVTLRGGFHMASPGGEYIGPASQGTPIAFFLDHINVKIYEGEGQMYELFNEHPQVGPSSCGEIWMTYLLRVGGTTPVEIVIHNPHRYGNDTAVDSLLSGIAYWTGSDFESTVLASGETQRNVGLLFGIGALVLLGIALFSSLLQITRSKLIWLFGFVTLFAGTYLAYSAPGAYFWSELIAVNTTVTGVSMMYYMLFVSVIIAALSSQSKRVAVGFTLFLGAADVVFLLLPVLTDIYFYDTRLPWALVQTLVNGALLICLIREFIATKAKIRWIYLSMTTLLLGFAADVVATGEGYWKGGIVSMYTFAALFLGVLFVVLRIIPQSIHAAAKAKELEQEKIVLNAQLAESRISTMMSQIRPHFIYNTLGSIEQLCGLDPAKASELVHNFAKYLRGNFRELDNPRPISMSQEMEHVHHYISIENVRFPDMTFTFEMNSGDFNIPALTIQPIVENAIKHGLMKLQKGGTIRVVSYETQTHYCVSVEDDGVGFDTGVLLDERKHVGLRNIRERLKAMVNGTLEIQSTVGEGTRVLITIPKEEDEDEEEEEPV